jgi:hypothetical protein
LASVINAFVKTSLGGPPRLLRRVAAPAGPARTSADLRGPPRSADLAYLHGLCRLYHTPTLRATAFRGTLGTSVGSLSRSPMACQSRAPVKCIKWMYQPENSSLRGERSEPGVDGLGLRETTSISQKSTLSLGALMGSGCYESLHHSLKGAMLISHLNSI